MKKIKKFAGVLMALCAMGSLFASGKKDEQKELKAGALSFLNLSEKDYATALNGRKDIELEMEKEGSIKQNDKTEPASEVKTVVFYDTLDAMLMALQSGEIAVMSGIPYSTAKYLCRQNPKFEMSLKFSRNLAGIVEEDSFSAMATAIVANGFSFMMLEKNKVLHDEFDKAIEEMKADGTWNKLVNAHILDVMNGKDIDSIIPEYKEGRKTIKVAVTGSLPPMDYVAPDGTFAGFNTAILAEIGKRLDRNITMVQVSSVGRATALASGTVDVAFWTRGLSEADLKNITHKSNEELKKANEAQLAKFTDEQKKAMASYLNNFSLEQDWKKDLPENTILTMPYFSDYPVSVQLKK